MQVRTTVARTRARENSEVAECNTLRRRERLKTCMAGLLGKDRIRIVLLKSENPTERECSENELRMRTPSHFAVIETSAKVLPPYRGGILLRRKEEVQDFFYNF